VLKWIAIVLGCLVVLVVAGVLWLKSAAAARYEKKYEVEVAAIPVPFPLTPAEIDALRKSRARAAPAQAPATDGDAADGAERAPASAEAALPAIENPYAGHEAAAAPGGENGGDAAAAENGSGAAPAAVDPLVGVDLSAVALRRAVARGKRYVETRAGCSECHASDFGGKVIMDNPAMGRWVAPNVTRGGVVKDYKPEDWVRIIRHGLRPDGTAATMPSTDYARFSDQEISDIAAFIQSLPKVDRIMEPSERGPVMALLVVKGDIPISAELIDHTAARLKYPPPVAATLELGEHLAAVCSGCHGHEFSGGPILGGDPAWPPASNLTFDATGLGKWSLQDFDKSLREGVRPDGRKLDPVMPVAYTARFKPAEIEALYLYFQSVPKKPYGNH
jgi:mono/diheme cytochrome c family protein